MLNNVSAFAFDLDGTLIDSADCAVESVHRAFRHHNLPVVEESLIRKSMGIPIEKMFPSFVEDGQVTDWTPIFATFREQYVSLSPELVKPFAGAVTLLESLHEIGKPISIVTSKKTGVAIENCKQTGLYKFIQHFIGSDLVDHYKPHPDGVLKAAALHDVTEQISKMLVVGDAAVDILMGQEAGAMTCAAMWGAHARDPLLELKPTFVAEQPLDILKFSYQG